MKAKKIVGVLLAFALAAMCFGCGDAPSYSEVAEADYASTIESFQGVNDEVVEGKDFGYELKMKMTMTYEGITTETEATGKFVFDAEGKMSASVESKAKVAGVEQNGKVYVDDQYLYMDVPAELSEMFGGKSKVKISIDFGNFGDSMVGQYEVLEDLLDMIISTDVSDIGKLEVSGKAGETRWLKITEKLEDGETREPAYMELKVDKDNKFQSVKVVMGEEDNKMEYEVKRFTGTITLPDLSAYEEFDPNAGEPIAPNPDMG